MEKYKVLYNPLAHKGNGLSSARKLETLLPGESIEYVDMTTIENPTAFISDTPQEYKLVFTGGDGTLNHVLHALDGQEFDRDILYFPAGSGNDFINDLGMKKDCLPFSINEYRKWIPSVIINGKRYICVNGVGGGLDGYACQGVDEYNRKGISKSYGSIAAKGLAGAFKRVHATVTIDGETAEYNKVWMASAMFGAYFGGGFKMAPMQDRNNPEHTFTVMVVHSASSAQALGFFLFAKNGHGDMLPNMIVYKKAHHMTVEFDRPVPVQIDGEVIRDVKRYEVIARIG